MRYLALIILSATIAFNLWLNYPETQILADPNDNIFQFSLVNRTDWIWKNYGCPLSLSCLPNLLDHNVTNWAEGYPLPFYYTHIPQIVTVASYHLIVEPITRIFNFQFSIFNYYNWTKYLLYTLFPIPVFIALRLVGFNPVLSATGAFFSSHYSTDGLYGIDPVSFLWRGYGLTSQLYGVFFLPLALAFTYRTLITPPNSPSYGKSEGIGGVTILFLTLTTAGHLGVGIMGFISTIPFLFLDLKWTHIVTRAKKLVLIYLGVFFLLSYWIIPILFNNNYHIISFWDPIWKFDSYGWYEVVRQYFMGEIFDWQRWPIITVLVTTGFFVTLSNSPSSPSYSKRGVGGVTPFAILFVFWFLMYFGRTTWGGLIDLIPGMKDFHQHRFIVGVQIASLFLLPAGVEYVLTMLRRIVNLGLGYGLGLDARFGLVNWFRKENTKPKPLDETSFHTQTDRRNLIRSIIFYILSIAFISALAYFTALKTYDYATLNNKWIYQANDAFRYDEKNFQDLLTRLDMFPNGRIYAGRRGNWGNNFRLGSTQMYMLLGSLNYDISQFLPETWSPLSENEQNFDERIAEDYDLLNIKYIVADKNHDFTSSAKLDKKYGPFEFYTVPTTGWFDVVTSPMAVLSDKTNYINIVHLWWTSYARRWKMHPLISVEKNSKIPEGIQRVLEMKDEVSYINAPQPPLTVRGDEGGVKNIFSDYPFVFPEATPSGKILNEKVERQTYSATVEVPDNCKSCFIMFKMSYHPNWTVKLDGNEAEKFAVFPFYLAVPALPGTHTIEFTYQPNRLKVVLLYGEIIILIGFILYSVFVRQSRLGKERLFPF